MSINYFDPITVSKISLLDLLTKGRLSLTFVKLGHIALSRNGTGSESFSSQSMPTYLIDALSFF